MRRPRFGAGPRRPGEPDTDDVAGGPSGRIVIVSGSVGAGHDGVAAELGHRLRALGHPVEMLDLLDGFPRPVRALLGSWYVATLRYTPFTYEWVCWLVEHSKMAQRMADALCCTSCGWLLDRVGSATVVVGTYPPAGRALGRLRERGMLTAPVVTYLTDPAPNYLWVHPANTLHLCATEATALETTSLYGVPVLAVGPLVAPAFRSASRAAGRKHLRRVVRSDAVDPIALVLLGSLGVGKVKDAVRALASAGVRPVVLCGRNATLRRRLAARQVTCLGWRDDLPLLLAGADLVVHNAGGLSLAESLAAGVPAVTFSPVPGHGRANARSLEQAGVVPWARTGSELTALARKLAGQPRQPASPPAETAAAVVSDLARRTVIEQLRREP